MDPSTLIHSRISTQERGYSLRFATNSTATSLISGSTSHQENTNDEMADGIKSRLRSASRSDLEVSEDDSFNAATGPAWENGATAGLAIRQSDVAGRRRRSESNGVGDGRWWMLWRIGGRLFQRATGPAWENGATAGLAIRQSHVAGRRRRSESNGIGDGRRRMLWRLNGGVGRDGGCALNGEYWRQIDGGVIRRRIERQHNSSRGQWHNRRWWTTTYDGRRNRDVHKTAPGPRFGRRSWLKTLWRAVAKAIHPPAKQSRSDSSWTTTVSTSHSMFLRGHRLVRDVRPDRKKPDTSWCDSGLHYGSRWSSTGCDADGKRRHTSDVEENDDERRHSGNVKEDNVGRPDWRRRGMGRFRGWRRSCSKWRLTSNSNQRWWWDGSGDASQPGSLRRVGFHSLTGENDVASEAGDRRRRGQRRRPATDTERSQSEYDTCFDTDADVRRVGSSDSLSSRGRRRRRRRSSSDSESTTSATALMEMMRLAWRRRWPTIVEELPRKTVGDGATTAKTGPTGRRHSRDVNPDLGDRRRLATARPAVCACINDGSDATNDGGRKLAWSSTTVTGVNGYRTHRRTITGAYTNHHGAGESSSHHDPEVRRRILAGVHRILWVGGGCKHVESEGEADVPPDVDRGEARAPTPRARRASHKRTTTWRSASKVDMVNTSRPSKSDNNWERHDAIRTSNSRDFADRLQEIALFYQALLGAVRSTPKLQHFIEEEHNLRRDLTIGDLLALTRRYMDRNPTETVLGGKAAVNVCKPVTQRKGQLSHEDDGVQDDVAAEQLELKKSDRSGSWRRRRASKTSWSTSTTSWMGEEGGEGCETPLHKQIVQRQGRWEVEEGQEGRQWWQAERWFRRQGRRPIRCRPTSSMATTRGWWSPRND